MRRTLPSLAVLALAALPLSAQSSQFGVRGLGLPGRGLSAASLGTEGADGLFDPRSSRNPAALGLLRSASIVFTSVQGWQTSENPGGSGSTRLQRFPLVMVGGPIPKSPLGIALTYSSYALRDYTVVSTGTDSPRGVPVGVTDSLGSTGGINDFRLGLSWSPHQSVSFGVGVHLLTGSNRVFANRAWDDTTYRPVRQTAELTYAGFGLSAGVVLQPTSRLLIAGTVRHDGSLDVERDSVASGSIGMPWTLGAAARLRLSDRLAISSQVSTSNWSAANDGIREFGGIGARNTIEVSAGMEWIRNVRRPDRLPLRIGIRRAELPFLVNQGSQPRELGLAIGTALRFAGDLGGIDLTLERVHRSQGSDYSENGWQLAVGVSLRGVASGP